MKAIKLMFVLAFISLATGCASGKLNYTEYQHKIMLCKQMDMEIHTVQAYDPEDGVLYTKDVVCKDKYGGTWSSDRM